MRIMQLLPTDIIYQILYLVDYSSLINIMQTSKRMYNIMDGNFWQNIYQIHYSKKINGNAKNAYRIISWGVDTSTS